MRTNADVELELAGSELIWVYTGARLIIHERAARRKSESSQ